MEFLLLGPVAVLGGEGALVLGGPKQRAVLTHLLLRANATVPVEVLIDALWADEPPETARGTLQAYVSRLRSILGDRIEGGSSGYRLRVDPGELDVDRFESLVSEGRADLADDPATAVRTWDDALTLWRGPALADLASEPSLRGEIARLEELRLACVEERITAKLASGGQRDVVAELEELTRRHPLRERLWGDLMLALYRSGRQADALDAFARARTILTEQLGVDPSRRLRRLHEQILAQDPTLSVPSRTIPRREGAIRLPTSGEIAPDTVLGGYRIEDVLGRGGMSVVYLAEDLRLHRRVALKVLSPALSARGGFRDRFVRESQIAAAIEHPGIVPIYEAGEAEGLLYIAMRYVRGTDLRRLIATAGPLETRRALTIVRRVAEALDAAHAEGLVHRDVKPANILIVEHVGPDEDDIVYLSDFGLTKRLEGDAGALTETGRFVGTVDYVAPEQIEGAELDARSDVYSLACVLFECLTGIAPHHRDGEAATLYAHLSGDAPTLLERRPDLPAELDHALARAMSVRAADRFTSCLAFVAAARATVDGPVRTSRAAPPPRRAAIAATVAAGLVALAVAGLALMRLGHRGEASARAVSASPARAPVFATFHRAPNADEARLLALVPDGSRGVCRPAAVGRTPSGSDRAIAAIACDQGDIDVRFELFRDLPTMDSAFGARVYDADAHGGDCAVDHVAQNGYTVEGRPSGRVMCTQTTDRSSIAWTDERVLVLGEAQRPDAGDLQLYRWWLTAGPVLSTSDPAKDPPPGAMAGGSFPRGVYASTTSDARTIRILGSTSGEPISFFLRLVDGSYRLVVDGGAYVEEGSFVPAKGNELVFVNEGLQCVTADPVTSHAPYRWTVRDDGSVAWASLGEGGCVPGPFPIVGPRHVWWPVPDGVTVFDEHGEIVRADLSTLTVRTLTQVEPEGVAIEPAWSPDGSRIAYACRTSSSDTFDLFVMNADGSDQRRLVELVGDEFDPAWSPDGTTIALRSVVPSGDATASSTRSSIRTVDATSPGAPSVEIYSRPGVMASHPSWSPDGSLLAFVADGDIEIVRADGSGRRRVAVSGVEGGRTVPTWTPDGKRLVFWARRGGREGLWSVRLDGGGLRPFGYVGLEDNPVAVSWSPDGRWVGLGTLPGATGVTSGTPMGASASPLPTKAYIGPAGSDRTFIIASLGTVPRWRPSTG